jgi:hypothetical protein
MKAIITRNVNYNGWCVCCGEKANNTIEKDTDLPNQPNMYCKWCLEKAIPWLKQQGVVEEYER